MRNDSYDALIIGSGAGGSAAAYMLARAGVRVAIIEKGTRLPRDASTLDIRNVVHEGRFKSKEPWVDGSAQPLVPEEYFNVGGKTKWYGAALLRFGVQEFDADSAHQCRAWPFRYEELAPYYDTAERLLRARHFDIEPGLQRIVAKLDTGWRASPLPLALDQAILANRNEATHFDGFASTSGLKSDAESCFLSRLADLPNVELITGREVVALFGHPLDRRRIVGVQLADGSRIEASVVLLAAGALHSPRLLQRYMQRSGLDASLPSAAHVGRNLKLHLLTAVVAVSPSRQNDLIRKTALLTNEAFPHSSVQPLGFDGELIGTLLPKLVPSTLAREIGNRAYGFFLQTEDGSHPDNRVIDGGRRSSDRSILDYHANRIAPALREHEKLVVQFRLALAKAGLLAFSQRIGLAGTAHACGTLIAGNDAGTSVVDSLGKVHGLESLYVVDGSVLPRSSRVNPSLTIYAWSLRIAERLARELANTPARTREVACA